MNRVACLPQALHGKYLLIFDFDGTVADTSQLHAAAFREALAPIGVTVDYSSIAGMKTADAMRKCLERAKRHLSDTELAALVEHKQQSVRRMIVNALQPLPGVDAFLRWARPLFKLAMATSGSRETVGLALGKLGYANWFVPLIFADDVMQAKPAPEGLLKVLALTNTAAADALVFEDSEAGFRAAEAANIAYVDVSVLDWRAAAQECVHGY